MFFECRFALSHEVAFRVTDHLLEATGHFFVKSTI